MAHPGLALGYGGIGVGHGVVPLDLCGIGGEIWTGGKICLDIYLFSFISCGNSGGKGARNETFVSLSPFVPLTKGQSR